MGEEREKERKTRRVWGERGDSPLKRARPERLRFPNPSVSTCDRVTGTTIHRHFAPFNPPEPAPAARVSSPSRPTGPFTAPEQPYSFVSSPYVYAYTKVCNFGVGYARYRTNERSVYRVSVAFVKLLQKKNVASFRKI